VEAQVWIAFSSAGLAIALASGLAVRVLLLRRDVAALRQKLAERDSATIDLTRSLDDARRNVQSMEAVLRSEVERRSAAEESNKQLPLLAARIEELERAKTSASSLCTELRESLGRRETELSAARDTLTELRNELAASAARNDALHEESSRLKEEGARTATTLRLEQAGTAEKIALLQAAREELTASFKAIAGDILDQNAKRFTEQNQESLSALLHPLRDRIKEFDQKVTSVYENESRERFSLQAEIRRLSELHARMSQETENLTRALKGSAKAQGTWGELVLEQVLSNSGLRAGEEYTVQPSLEDAEGNRLQPDVVIILPENKRLVVDSKISLTAYERYVRSSDPAEQAQNLREHIESVRRHVKGLAAKNYHELYGINSPDFVLMFLAIEPAFMLAMKEDPQLFSWSLTQNILLVCPSTLLATARLIASIWRYEHQNRNAQEIARRAGRLYDKFVGFVSDLLEVGKRLSTAQAAYDSAHRKLASGKGNLVGAAESIKKLGVKPSKALPPPLLEISGDDEIDIRESDGDDSMGTDGVTPAV
jgi:DNA recombination protein RmuC